MKNFYFGWRWSPRLWYWNFWYDGSHHVVQIIFLQIEYHAGKEDGEFSPW